MTDTPAPADIRGLDASPVAAAVAFKPGRAWAAVVLLFLVGVVNIVDRVLPGLLVEPIKHDLGLSDTAVGLINGFGFLAVYSLVGLPLARIADRGLYGLVISSCVGLWSLMTLLGSMTQTGLQFAATRMGVAIGEAGNTPTAHAFVARNFAPTRRGLPLAVLSMAVPCASLLGTMGGGLLGQAVGWRNTLLFMGLVGLVLAPLVLLVLGPRQPVLGSAPSKGLNFRSAGVLLRKPSYLTCMAAVTFIGMGGYTMVTFGAAFLMRVHHMSLAQVGLNYGLAAGTAGLISTVISGVSADRLSRRDPRWCLGVIVIMVALLAPFAFAAFLVKGAIAALVCMALGNIIGGGAYLTPSIAAIQRLAPVDLKATASAIFLLCGSMGGAVGPLIAGMISDALTPKYGANALAHAMMVTPIAYTMAGILFGLATLTYRRDMVEDEKGDD